MTRMEITEEHVDAFLHYSLRILILFSLVGLVFAIYAIAMGWE